ncbi:hypothetical protein CDCA_CDCA19G4628 [Cyanidium caldarium]|uniref:Thiamin pyrophosphokinase thiamin-binding domain-containing protein n=1 Tax=Cyanidium caldarium TaxID=2771 RepID=A0AAV9J1X1_CYACA|nr:hypothetical protein CDCA_CDCA19G4628 [Cyanidium caldarium]
MTFIHDHGDLFGAHDDPRPDAPFTVLLVLNGTPDAGEQTLLRRVARLSQFIIAADGGANTLHRLGLCPQVVAGDLDSLHPDTRHAFRSAAVQVYRDADPSRNDFQKALQHVPDQARRVLVLGAEGGRLDHALANLHVAFEDARKPQHASRDLLLLSQRNLAMVLRPGSHELHIHAPHEGPACGLIPLGHACNVRTQHLRWNVDCESPHSSPLQFGTFISSSNAICGPSVLVWTDAPLLWTHQLRL